MAKTKGKSAKAKKTSTAKAAKVAKQTKTKIKATARAAKPAPAPLIPGLPARPPLPPPPPPPPPPRDEMPATRDVARLARYGERFGAYKLDVRPLAAVLPVTSGAIAIFDPAMPKSWRVFDRPLATGALQFRMMASFARSDGGKDKLAALVIHVGRPPITRWTVAHYKGSKKPKSADALPACPVTSGHLALVDAGSGAPGAIDVPAPGPTAPPAIAAAPSPADSSFHTDVALPDGRRAVALRVPAGDYTAYWGIDATDKPVCLLVDFDAFTQKEWKSRPQ